MTPLALIAVLVIGYFLIGPTLGGLLAFALSCLVWALIGWLAGLVLRGRGFGFIGNLAMGLAGGVVGVFTLRLIGFVPLTGGFLSAVIVGIFGSVILTVIVRLLFNSKFAR